MRTIRFIILGTRFQYVPCLNLNKKPGLNFKSLVQFAILKTHTRTINHSVFYDILFFGRFTEIIRELH